MNENRTVSATREILADRIVTTEVTEEPRIVDWDDIEGGLEYDDYYCEAPWEHCDGWEHRVEESNYRDHDDRTESYTYFNRGRRYGGSGYITIDTSQLYDGPPGCSKQARFEAIAKAKREATEQLVKWYEDGWNVYVALAKYGSYSDSLGGIYDDDDAGEYVEECRHGVADQLEADGYVIENRPDRKPYRWVDAFKDRIRRNLDCA